MATYDENASLALRLISEKGAALTFKRFIMGAFDPVTGGSATITYIKSPAVAVILPVNKSDSSRMSERLIEALTQGRLRKLLIATKGMLFEPSASDFTEFEGSYWTIAGLSTLKPDGVTPIICTAFVERVNLSGAQVAATEVPL